MEIPTPAEILHGETVIASAFLTDEPDDTRAIVLTLRKGDRINYAISELNLLTGEQRTQECFANIHDAVAYYREAGGE